MKKSRKRLAPKELKDPVPPPPTNDAQSNVFTPLERAKSESVKLTEQLDNLVESIEHWRTQVNYHTREAADAKEKLQVATLNHASMRSRLLDAVDIPRLVG